MFVLKFAPEQRHSLTHSSPPPLKYPSQLYEDSTTCCSSRSTYRVDFPSRPCLLRCVKKAPSTSTSQSTNQLVKVLLALCDQFGEKVVDDRQYLDLYERMSPGSPAFFCFWMFSVVLFGRYEQKKTARGRESYRAFQRSRLARFII